MHNNTVLDNNKNLLSYNIDINDCVDLTEVQEISTITHIAVVNVLGNFNVPSVIQVNLQETVNQMKEIISNYSKNFDFIIFKDGIKLTDSCILADCHFIDDCQIYAIRSEEGNLKVNSLIRNQEDLLVKYQITNKVIDLKHQVSNSYNYNMDDFELFLDKEMLDDNRFLFEYLIKGDSIIRYYHTIKLQVELEKNPITIGAYCELFKAQNQAGKTIIVKRYLLSSTQRLQQQKLLLNELIVFNFIEANQYFPKFEGFFKQDNYIYIAMEYINGGSLDKYIKNIPHISDIQLAKWTTGILNALVFLHDNKIIYRNLKPSNILLTNDNQIKICGFSMSKYFIGTTKEDLKKGFRQTKTNNYRYMAPEIFNNEEYGNTVDIWSLGVILLAFALGHPPYQDLDDLDVARRVANDKAITYEIPKDRSRCLKNFIERCVQGNPKNRPTAEELLKDNFIKAESNNFIDAVREMAL